MSAFAYLYRVIVVNICAYAMIIMLQVHMSSLESGLSEEHDPMVVTSDDEIAQEPGVFTSDTESDPEMISEDEDDFHPFALSDFGDDITYADDILIDDVFALPIPVHEHLIIGHRDGEVLVAPLPIDVVPLAAGDGEVDDVIVLDVPPTVVPFIDISSDSSVYSVADSFESVTSSACRLRDSAFMLLINDDAMSAAPSSPIRAPTPPHVPGHVPDPDPVSFGLPFVAPLIPEPVSAPLNLPPVVPLIPQPPPVDVVPPHFVSDEHRTDLPIVFLQEIPAPRPGEGTSGQPPSFDPFASADFPPFS
ncbi:hypothetical protein HanOQP8_Chr10g0361521 [Helianthus annuus]|nr:hypothetical protein HanOQP8_Chr10g0361521 [Helianthus annuus]KAJ0883366.1 hypothetical protein HanPSC8_Chr10g0420651 [Helianthus annuus]